MGGVVKSVAKIAVPVIATVALGPAGAGIFSAVGAGIAGGAIGGLVQGGGIKGALLGGITGGLTAGAFSGKGGSLFGGLTSGGGGAATTGQGFLNQLGGRGPALSSFAQNVTSRGAAGVASATQHLSAGVAHSQPYAQQTLFHGGATAGITDAGSKIGANVAAQVKYDQSRALIDKLAPKTDMVTKNIGEDTIMGLSKDQMQGIVTGGMELYEESLRQAEIEALEKNLEGFRPEYAKHYQDFAKRELAQAEAGELGPGYEEAFEDEARRLERLLTASGHNVRDLNEFARTNIMRGLGTLKAGFLDKKKEMALAYAGGADTMQTRLEEQRQRLALSAPGEDFGPLRDVASTITDVAFDKLI